MTKSEYASITSWMRLAKEWMHQSLVRSEGACANTRWKHSTHDTTPDAHATTVRRSALSSLLIPSWIVVITNVGVRFSSSSFSVLCSEHNHSHSMRTQRSSRDAFLVLECNYA